MKWYWIVLICVAYIYLWALTVAGIRKSEYYKDGLLPIGAVIIGFLWPFVFLSIAVYGMSTRIIKRYEKTKEEQQ